VYWVCIEEERETFASVSISQPGREGILLKSRHLSFLLMLVWNFNEDYSDQLL
jgi:hypothetical protein